MVVAVFIQIHEYEFSQLRFVSTGYEYTVEATFGGYGPVEKTYHLCRRRRWVRNRVVVKDSKQEEEEVNN